MSNITCHVLDTSLGRPAAGVRVRLERRAPTGSWQPLGEAITNSDGRVARFEPAAGLESAVLDSVAVQSVALQSVALQSAALDSMGLDSAPLEAVAVASGEHRISFDTGAYFEQRSQPAFYPRVEVTFSVASPSEHYHIPLLLSPFGYSTYRGS